MNKESIIAQIKAIDEQIESLTSLFDIHNPDQEMVKLKLYAAQYAIEEAVKELESKQ